MNIFAVKEDKVETYSIDINKILVKEIQSKIDDWTDKGELMECVTAFLPSYNVDGKRNKVVSVTPLGKGQIFYECCPDVVDTTFYKFEYYQFRPHKLSDLCEEILTTKDSIDLSRCIAQIYNWSSFDETELLFIKELKGAFKFKKIVVEDIVKSDIPVEEKKGILNRIKSHIKKQKQKQIVTPKSYDEEVNVKLMCDEAFITAFYHKELKEKEFSYSEEQREREKVKIFKSLPLEEQLISK